MKLVLRSFALGLSLLLTLTLSAQTDTVNVATIASINITLDDDCQATVIPEQVLAGDFGTDDDDELAAVLANFQVTVMDEDESNGGVIDGCGSFTFRIEADTTLITGFTVGWGLVQAEDKTAPFFVSTPAAPAGPLYCDALAGVELGTLPSDVARCFTYSTVTNTVVAPTLDARLEARLMAGGGLPVADDNCSELLEICVSDIVTRDPVDPACSDVTVTRTFTATDGSCGTASGETNAAAVTSYDIVFTRPLLDSLNTESIDPVVEVECGELAGLGVAFGDVIEPTAADLPFFPGPDGTTVPLSLGEGGSFCNIGVAYTDGPIITTCELGYKYVRTYTVIDWCNPTDIRTFNQVVKVGDFVAPVLTVPTAPLVFPTNTGTTCEAIVRLDAAGLSVADACGGTITLTADIFPFGDLTATPLGTYTVDLDDNDGEFSDRLPVGDHIVRYTYRDDCNNRAQTEVTISVVDDTPPVAICTDGLNVTLAASISADPSQTGGIAVLTPDMIDGGSYDNCSGVTLAIGRVGLQADGTYDLLPNASYGPQVVLNCEDADQEVLIGLRVADASGVFSYCWMAVLVEDKADPVCFAPADLTVDCRTIEIADLPEDITTATDAQLEAAFGVAAQADNCGATIEQDITGMVNSCGLGSYRRVFTVTDNSVAANSVVCEQIINVVGLHDYVITLPGDTRAFCMQSPNVPELEIVSAGCDLITVQVERDTFESDADECYKVRLEHLIINWCEYNTLGDPYVLPRDFDGDNNLREDVFLYVLPGDETTTGDDVAVMDVDAVPGNGNYTWPVDEGPDGDDPTAVYAADDSRGAFLYRQFVKIQDEVSPQVVADNINTCFSATSANCTGSATIEFEVSDNCTAVDQLIVSAELDEDYDASGIFVRDRFLLPGEISMDAEGNVTVNLANLLTGEYALRARVADGCGNANSRIIEFCVEDNLAPTPICIQMTTVTLSPNGDGTGMAAFWATDAIASDVADCSGEVSYSIYKLQETLVDGFEPAPDRDGVIFTCDDDASSRVRLYAFDPAGRSDYCEVFILVQRADNACVLANPGLISGSVSTVNGTAVSDVQVTLTGGGPELITATNASGVYEFGQLEGGEDYTLNPLLDDYVLHSQGVSTFDLVLITRYVLGLTDLGSPYQRLAADANNDEDISVQDIIAIRRLILGLDEGYPENAAWRFVDASFVFPVGTNPWATAFPEVLNINNLDGSVRDGDFIAVMVGDVSGNSAGLASSDDGLPRSGGRSLRIDDQRLVPGERYNVAVYADQLAELDGAQGTLVARNGARLTDVTPGAFTAGHLNAAGLDRGQLHFSHNGTLDADEVLFTLELAVTEATTLREVLTLDGGRLRAEGYTAAGRVAGLGLRFTTAREVAQNHLLQNAPNPVGDVTTIRYELAEAGPAVLTVRDLNGRVVLQRTLAGTVGANQVTLTRADLQRSGVLTYTLAANGFVATRKMVIR